VKKYTEGVYERPELEDAADAVTVYPRSFEKGKIAC
jgi:hypothetical protein